jgi:hypothetical protein
VDWYGGFRCRVGVHRQTIVASPQQAAGIICCSRPRDPDDLKILVVEGDQHFKGNRQLPVAAFFVPRGGTCPIAVTFTPSASGLRTGTLTITNSAGSPQTIGVTGIGVDFALATSTAKKTIQAGGAATYSLTVTPVGAGFPSAIQMSCTGLPQGATCNFAPGSLTPGIHTTTTTLNISTTASVADDLPGHSVKGYAAFGICIPFQAFGLFGMVFVGCTKRSRKLAVLALLALLIAGTLFMSACTGGTGTASQSQTQTASKSYSIFVNGTSGNLQHSVPLTLTVQQN